MTGVRSAAREDGRREGGHEESGCPMVTEDVDRTRLWPLDLALEANKGEMGDKGEGGGRTSKCTGRSLIHAPNSFAVIGTGVSALRAVHEADEGIKKTREARKSATVEVMPVNLCKKKLAPSCRKRLKEGQTPSAVSVQGL